MNITDYYKTQPEQCFSTDELIQPGEIFFYSHIDKCLVLSEEIDGTDIYDKKKFTLLGTVIRTSEQSVTLLSPQVISEELWLQSREGASTDNLLKHLKDSVENSDIRKVKSRLFSSDDLNSVYEHHQEILSGMYNMSGMIPNNNLNFSEAMMTGTLLIASPENKLNVVLGGIAANINSRITEYLPSEENNGYSALSNDEFFAMCSDRPEIITLSPDDETPEYAKAEIKEKTYGDLTLNMSYDDFLKRFPLVNLVDIYSFVCYDVKLD